MVEYDEDINRLMASNPDLTSCFSETVIFKNPTASLLLDAPAGQSGTGPPSRSGRFLAACWPASLLDPGVFWVPIHSSWLGGEGGRGWDIKPISDTNFRREFFLRSRGRLERYGNYRINGWCCSSVHYSEVAVAGDGNPNLQTSYAAMPAMAGLIRAAFSFTVLSWVEQEDSSSTTPDAELKWTSTEADLNGPRDPMVSNEIFNRLEVDRKLHETQISRDTEILSEEKAFRKRLDSNSKVPYDYD